MPRQTPGTLKGPAPRQPLSRQDSNATLVQSSAATSPWSHALVASLGLTTACIGTTLPIVAVFAVILLALLVCGGTFAGGSWLGSLTIDTIVVPAVVTTVITFYNSRVERAAAKGGLYQHVVNISLNIFEDGYLKIRTLHEGPLQGMLNSEHLQRVLDQRAAPCGPKNPIVNLNGERPSEAQQIRNTALNFISSQWSEPCLAQTIFGGAYVKCEKFVYCFTDEAGPEGGWSGHMVRKYRIMMITERQLKQIHEKSDTFEPKYEAQPIELRYETMRSIAKAYFDEGHELHESTAIAFITVAKPPGYDDSIRPSRNSLPSKEFTANACPSPR